MSLKGKDLANKFYDVVLITLGAVGVSYVSRKITKDGLGVPSTPQGILKMRWPSERACWLSNTYKPKR